MKNTTDSVTATILAQLEHLAVDVSPDTADEVSLAMVRGCVRALKGRKQPLSRLIEVIVDEAWSAPLERLQ